MGGGGSSPAPKVVHNNTYDYAPVVSQNGKTTLDTITTNDLNFHPTESGAGTSTVGKINLPGVQISGVTSTAQTVLLVLI